MSFFWTPVWCRVNNINNKSTGQIDLKNGINQWIHCTNVLFFCLQFLWNISHSSGTDPEETILNAFKIFDPEGKGILRGEEYALLCFLLTIPFFFIAYAPHDSKVWRHTKLNALNTKCTWGLKVVQLYQSAPKWWIYMLHKIIKKPALQNLKYMIW